MNKQQIGNSNYIFVVFQESHMKDIQEKGMNFTDSINFLSHEKTTQNPTVKTKEDRSGGTVD